MILRVKHRQIITKLAFNYIWETKHWLCKDILITKIRMTNIVVPRRLALKFFVFFKDTKPSENFHETDSWWCTFEVFCIFTINHCFLRKRNLILSVPAWRLLIDLLYYKLKFLEMFEVGFAWLSPSIYLLFMLECLLNTPALIEFLY